MRGLLGANPREAGRDGCQSWKQGVCEGDKDSVKAICSNRATLAAGSCWNV